MAKANIATSDCLICDRIGLIKANNNPFFVEELSTGFIVMGDHQFFKGYTLFLCKEHQQELHDLEPEFRQTYLWEMSIVAEAVFKAFRPKKLNYELLGNTDHHMHWHIFPRHENDPLPNRTVWNINKEIRTAESSKPAPEQLNRLVATLQRSLGEVLKKPPVF